MSERTAALASLRLRLGIGAGVIALVAVLTALLTAQGATDISRMIERSAAAQSRIDLLSGLSARVSDYAVVAVETTAPDVPTDSRRARLSSQSERIRTAFEELDRALARAVAAAATETEAAQMRLATRSLGLARMRAQVGALERAVDKTDTTGTLRTHLDGFATQFSPLINDAIAEEQRDRDAARHAVSDLRDRMIWRATFAATGASLLTIGFYVGLVGPLVSRLTQVREAAAAIGDGKFDVALGTGGQSELDRLMRQIDSTASRLHARQEAVEADRARLSEIIAERTDRLEEANERLAGIDSDRRRFFADVGHELRTPLTVILAESELALTDDLTADDVSEALKVIHARARRLNRRIDDLLRVARSETGQIDLEDVPFDLAKSAAEAVEDMKRLAERRNVQLVTQLQPAAANGDSDWTRQVISGLIENAVKKSSSGGVVEVSCREEGQQAKLTVLDEGEGLPPGEAERVFNRFLRGTREASGSGFGVGLALARWVVEHQGGSIDLESPARRPPLKGTARGPGFEITISLPVTDAVSGLANGAGA